MERRPRAQIVWEMDPRPDDDGWVEVEGTDMSSGRREHARVRVQPDDAGRLAIRELHLLDVGEPITAQRLRTFTLGTVGQMIDAAAIVREQTGEQPRRRRPLKPPAGRGYPDEFYEHVAARYRAAQAMQGVRPVMAIAKEAGVPRSTAARWVKEARRREKLGKTKRGRAGG
jgi:hypothetical protein